MEGSVVVAASRTQNTLRLTTRTTMAARNARQCQDFLEAGSSNGYGNNGCLQARSGMTCKSCAPTAMLPKDVEDASQKTMLGSAPIRYPHSPHLPWSPGYDEQEDLILCSAALEGWKGKEVVITEKMDGECTTLTKDYMHARSPNYSPHPSRTKMRAEWGRVRNDIPPGWKVLLENVSAKHSIGYTDLLSYFLVFSIWEENGLALSWDGTEFWCQLLGLCTVPVLWRGVWDEDKCRKIIDSLDLKHQEGIVVRLSGCYRWNQIANPLSGALGKWVRRGHVTTDEHWMDRPVEWNRLREGR
jgi:hypothetical protein